MCLLLFKIPLTYICFCLTEIASYADDNVPNATRYYVKIFLQKVEKASKILLKWLTNDYMITNVNKCYLITSTSREVGFKIEDEIIKNSLPEKPLEIVIDNRLTFVHHFTL